MAFLKKIQNWYFHKAKMDEYLKKLSNHGSLSNIWRKYHYLQVLNSSTICNSFQVFLSIRFWIFLRNFYYWNTPHFSIFAVLTLIIDGRLFRTLDCNNWCLGRFTTLVTQKRGKSSTMYGLELAWSVTKQHQLNIQIYALLQFFHSTWKLVWSFKDSLWLQTQNWTTYV